MLGPEDLPLGIPMLLDVLFYSALVWVAVYAILFLRRQAIPRKLLLMSLPLNAVLAAALWVFYLIFSFTLGFRMVGRGHGDSVYVDTAQGRESVMGFWPYLPIPLDEVIDYYGDPDQVGFTSEGAKTGLLLYWDSVDMLVALPQIADETYPVRTKTAIEWILFYEPRDVTAVAGAQVEGKTPWRGYGNYQP